MINDPAYPKPNHCDNCGDVLDTHYGEWYREECYCETCGLPLCRDCYDEHLWDDHMAPEVRREFELLQVENSDLLRKSKRAVELLRRVIGCLGVKGCLTGAEKYLRECGETGPVLKDEVHNFLRELGGASDG